MQGPCGFNVLIHVGCVTSENFNMPLYLDLLGSVLLPFTSIGTLVISIECFGVIVTKERLVNINYLITRVKPSILIYN